MPLINGVMLPNLKDHDPLTPSKQRRLGPLLGLIGMTLVVIASIANWVSIGDVGSDGAAVAETTMWAGGLGVFGLGTIKIGIATVLIGIILRLWIRVDSIEATLTLLRVKPGAASDVTPRAPSTLTESDVVPEPLKMHVMASKMWKPMLLMGAMLVTTGLIIRFFASSAEGGTESFRQVAAWGPGTQFLGEAMLLTGVTFLLGTILASLRQGAAKSRRPTAIRSMCSRCR